MPRDWMEDGRRRWRDGLSHACVRGVNTTESLPAANQAGGGAEGEVLGMPRGLWASYLATYKENGIYVSVSTNHRRFHVLWPFPTLCKYLYHQTRMGARGSDACARAGGSQCDY